MAEEKKKNKKALIVVLIIIIILVLLLAAFLLWFLLKDKGEKTSAEGNGATITPSSKVEDLVSDPDPLSSSRAVKDKDGLIYYGFNQPDEKSIMVLDKEEGMHGRWSSTSEENIEIAGIDADRVIFFFTDKESVSCQEAWSTDHTYYGIGLGTVSYSGAAGLLLENNENLIEGMKKKCK